MPRIRQLDPSLVNKIAAGEVIERPASVVKELVENSIDAGATRIDVALQLGGVELIRITDDGCGIGPDDLPLALAPHATSKLYSSDDLFNIQTMGFRGEALASIASVSHLRIVSRPSTQVEGYEVSGDASPPAPGACAAPTGTTIEVRNLFYNVPARRKFLKQPQTECSHVTEQIARLSLAHPHIGFTVTHNGRSIRNLPATTDRRERIADFYGADLADCLIPVRSEEHGLIVEGLIAPPAHSRASTKWQYLFLNGRFITDRRIAYAVREAFRGLVEHDRFPVVFLFLAADPHDYDVNVHPTKIEVRWRDAGLVQSQVLAVLRETLLSHDLTPAMKFNRADMGAAPIADDPFDSPTGRGPTPEQQRARQALADYLKRVDPTQPRLTFSPPPFRTDALRPSIAGTLNAPRSAGYSSALDHPAENSFRSGAAQPLDAPPRPASPSKHEAPPDGSSLSDVPDAEADAAFPSLPTTTPANGVMQIHNTYLVAQTETGVLIIDQHALHERILYERFRERILQGPLESQRLLIPEPVSASPTRIDTADHFRPMLARLGIELEQFGPNTLAVQAFPTLLKNVRISEFVADLLDKLVETEDASTEETAIHAALDMMACKAAVKAGDALTPDEMHALLEMRHLTERSSNCPHGRPTTLELSTRDLEKQFKRI